MLTRTRTSVPVLVLALGATMPLPAAAQPRDTVPYASGFAGGSVIPTFAVKIADPATATAVDLQGRKLDNAATWGGSIGLWKRAGSRWMWGLRGEFSHQKTDASQQMLPASGTLFGQPYDGPLPAPAADGSATFVTGVVLLGWRLGSDTASAFGRATPYAGLGGGIEHVSATFTGLGEGSDTGPTFQVIGGVNLGLSRRVSAFAEYRFQRVRQQIVIGTQSADFTVKPHHVVAGFTVGLF